MRREEFLRELSYLLQDIPEADREEALKYYEEYLEDAPAEEEEEIIRKLGSPEKVAAEIREGLRADAGQEDFGEYTDAGYTDRRFEEHRMPGRYAGRAEDSQERSRDTGWEEKAYREYGTAQERDAKPGRDEQNGQEREQGKKGGGCLKPLLIILLCICAAPLLIPLALVAAAGALGGIVAGLGVIVAFLVGGGALFLAGIWTVGKGLGLLFLSPATGLMICGMALVGAALGILLCCLVVWLFFKVAVPLVNALVRALRRPFERGGSRA